MSISAVIQPVRLVSLRATAAAALRVRSKSTRVRAVHRSATIMAAGDLTANPLASWSFGRSPPSDAPDLPKWSSITPEHVKPAIMAAVDKVNAEIDAIEAELNKTNPSSWCELMDPLERLSEELSRPWGVVSHLKGVRDSEALRAAYDECQPAVVTASLRVGQSRPVYDALVALTENKEAWASLTDAQRRAVTCEVRDAKLSGVALDGAEKDRYNEIAKEMSELSTKFSNNVLDATKAFSHTCVEKSEVEGLPDSALEQAAQTASQKGGHENATAADGPWMFTLDAPSYMAVRSHSKNRTLREKGESLYSYFRTCMGNVIDVVFCVQCTARTSHEPRNTSHPSWTMPR